jgi:Dolichyl-phosphate-mannose-protein mannosyltransferase
VASGMVGVDCESKRTPRMAQSSFTNLQKVAVIWAVLSIIYGALVYLQIQRHLWFDELLTLHIANAPDLVEMLPLVKRWDLNPPLSHLLAHASLRLFPGRPIAVRFPSVIEFYLASLLLYVYSARKLGSPFAALPILFLWYSAIFQYATEARPYALLCLFFCALLLLWDLAIARANRSWILIGIVVSSAGLLSSHVLAPLSLLPFFAAEILRFLIRREPDYPLWAALSLPLVLVVSYAPFLRNYSTITYYPLAFQAGLDKIASFYWHTFRDITWCLLLVLVSGFVAVRGKWSLGWPLLRPSEICLFTVLAIIPILLDFAMMRDHAPFWGRYVITSVVALYFLSALVLASVFRRSSRVSYLAVSVVLALLLTAKIAVPLYQNSIHPAPANAAALARVRPDLPLVAASGLTFIEMGQYESPALRARLFYLRDRSAAIQFAHATIFEDLTDFQQAFKLAGEIEPYGKFTRDHNHFLVFGTIYYPEDWLLRKLLADGATIVPIGSYETPYKDKTLFDIHMRLRPSAPVPAVPAHGTSNL